MKRRIRKLIFINVLLCILGVFLIAGLYFAYLHSDGISLAEISQLNQAAYLKQEHQNIQISRTDNEGHEETIISSDGNVYLQDAGGISYNRLDEQIRYGCDNLGKYFVRIGSSPFADPWDLLADCDLSDLTMTKKRDGRTYIGVTAKVSEDKLYDFAKQCGIDRNSGLGSAEVQLKVDRKSRAITELVTIIYDLAGNRSYSDTRQISYDGDLDLSAYDKVLRRAAEKGNKTVTVISDPDTALERANEYTIHNDDRVEIVTDENSTSEKIAADENAEIYHIYSTDTETLDLPAEDVYDASGFVLLSDYVPDAILEIRYYSTYNFIGERFTDYREPIALITIEAAQALKEASDELIEKGYRLKIFDAYRPTTAEDFIMEWAEDESDIRMKEYFYPNLDKETIVNRLYLARRTGHSRGSTVDLTLFDMRTEKEVDMGTTYDFLDESSHPDYEGVSEEQYENRMLLRDTMMNHGFRPFYGEWWHFVLVNEPYPTTNFAFPVSKDVLKNSE